MEAIGLHLMVHKIVWIVVKDKALPNLEGCDELGMVITDVEDAKKAQKNGHKLIEIDWCRFQTLITQMRGR